jgi:hypothetical protein
MPTGWYTVSGMNVVPDLSNNSILQQNYVLIRLEAEILCEK